MGENLNRPRAYSVKRLSEEWGCSAKHIYRMIESGELRAFPIGARGLRVAALEAERAFALRNDPNAQWPPSAKARRYIKIMWDIIRSHPSDGGHVYFMQCKELVKIGYSARPGDRWKTIQDGIPFKVTLLGHIQSSLKAERALHAALEDIKYERMNEWFYHDEDLLRAIHFLTRDSVGQS